MRWHDQRFILSGLLALALGSASLLPAAIIGTNTPAQPVTAERIAILPAGQQPAWRQYLERSERQSRADRAFVIAELREHGLKAPSLPPQGSTFRNIPLHEPARWYGQDEARRIADIVLSFQTPAGGWSKNLNMAQHPRAPGEHFALGNLSRFPGPADFDTPHDFSWSYVGTFDNDATIAQLRFLAKVVAALNPTAAAPYRTAFLRGLDYIFAAQYPNGGWPQVWPLQGGYHDDITYNDDAMTHILNLLRDVAQGKHEFAFVPAHTRRLAAASLKRGIRCVLACQICVQGRRTVWCQQHDAITLQPASARNYEMPSQASAESARLMLFLMDLPDPDPQVVAAVHAAAAWFEKTGIRDVAYRFSFDYGRRLVPASGNGPLWARYYEIGADRPIFGDRDKSIHDDVSEISSERRNGYSWYGPLPRTALQRYDSWRQSHPLSPKRPARAPLASPRFSD